jgi:hypothetical protein
MTVKEVCGVIVGPGCSCTGEIEYEIAARYDGMLIQCPLCTCWQEWVAEREVFVASRGPSEPLDIYGVHGR